MTDDRSPRPPQDGTLDAERLRDQALEISIALSDTGVGSCTLPEGVRKLVAEIDRLRAELATLRQALDLQQRKEQTENRFLELRERAEAAESRAETLQRERDHWKERTRLASATVERLEQERDVAVALNVTIESMQNERMLAVGTIEKQLVQLRAALTALSARTGAARLSLLRGNEAGIASVVQFLDEVDALASGAPST